MNGLQLSKKYFEVIVEPAFKKELPIVLERAAIGLAGEGSECFGFDDEISRDHDWGPGVCIWLTKEDYESFGAEAKKIYESLPKQFLGFERLRPSVYSEGRVGVLNTDEFYAKYMGISTAPAALWQWRNIPEEYFAVASNGEVWQDPLGAFSKIRNDILAYYPEDVRKKKISMHAAFAAQAGQYNYYRCEGRGECTAAQIAISKFVQEVWSVAFLLNFKYCPYYKWAQRALRELPLLGSELAGMIDALFVNADKKDMIEGISAKLIECFREQGLSSNRSDFLLHHAEEILAGVNDLEIRNSHIMSI